MMSFKKKSQINKCKVRRVNNLLKLIIYENNAKNSLIILRSYLLLIYEHNNIVLVSSRFTFIR